MCKSLRGLDVRFEYLGTQPAPIIPTPAGFFIPRRPYDECVVLWSTIGALFLGAFTPANLVVGVGKRILRVIVRTRGQLLTQQARLLRAGKGSALGTKPRAAEALPTGGLKEPALLALSKPD